MIITAEQKNSRQSDRKVLLVANAVKKLEIPEAIKQLGVIEKKASIVILKVLRQAIANATHNHGLAVADLAIKAIIIGGGTPYKRFRAASRGRAHSILKRTCHVRVELITKSDIPVKALKTDKKAIVAADVKKATKVVAKAAKATIEKTTKKATKSKKAE